MENGDRRKISQRRLLGVHPDHLDSRRRIVARGRGSDVPAAVHVSGSGGEGGRVCVVVGGGGPCAGDNFEVFGPLWL